MLVHDILEFHARVRPDAPALRDGTRTITFGELDAMAESIANALAASGVGPGDRYAVLAGNCLEFFALYFGAAKIGAVTVPLNQRLAPPEWVYILKDSGSRLVIGRGDLVAVLDGARDDLPEVDTFVAMGATHDGWLGWDEWLAAAPPRPALTTPVQSDDAVVQMYTSGTTGRPKGAIVAHARLTESLVQVLIVYLPGADGCIHVAMPLSHMGSTAMGLIHLLCGGSVYVQAAFDPIETVRILEHEGVTRTLLVPAMIQAILAAVPDLGDRDFPKLEMVSYGASPIAPETLRRAMAAFGCEFGQGFGQTEASGSITFLTHLDHHRAMAGEEHLLASCGRPAVSTEVRIVDPDGNDCAPGDVGEIIMRGPQQMLGYWNMPEETARVLRDGWLHTGDAGTLDEEGFLYVKDRIKDMIVSGGENVYSAEVEHALFEHPAVADAAVIGVPDERWGEAVKALVVLKPDTQLDEVELIAFCKARIAGFKVPKSVTFVDVLPRNASGKVLKFELRAPYWEGQSRGIA